MIQTFFIVRWARPEREPIDRSVLKALAVCSALRDLGPELSPQYESARGPREARPFNFHAAWPQRRR